MSFYLEKINRMYYFRLRVPRDLVPYLGTNQLRKSLKTSDFADAKSIVKGYLYATEKLFVAIRSGMLTHEQIIEMVVNFRNNHLTNQEKRRSKLGKRAYYPFALMMRDVLSTGALSAVSVKEVNAAIIEEN